MDDPECATRQMSHRNAHQASGMLMNTKQRLALGAVGAAMLADVSGGAVMSGQEMDTDIGIGGDIFGHDINKAK